MPTLRNNFSGGPDTTTISTSNSGQFGDNVFDNVDNSTTGGQVNRFASVARLGLNRPTAEFVYELATGATANSPWLQWDSSFGTQITCYTRFYVYLSSLSTLTGKLNLFTVGANGFGDLVSVSIRTNSTPYVWQIVNEYTGATSTLGSAVVAAGEWFRIEFKAIISPTSGSAILNYYGGNDVDTTNLTDTVSQSSQNYSSGIAGYWALGQEVASLANIPTMYYSNWELNTTGFPGPAPFRQGLGSPPGNLTNPVSIHMI